MADRIGLVIEDEAPVAQAIASMLRECGLADVHTTGNGRLGLAALQTNDVALVVCDLEMPGMDGIQFIEELAGQSSRVPLLLISGTNEKVLRIVEGIAQDHGLHVVGALNKPVLVQDLRRIVGALGDRRISSPAPAAPITDSELETAIAQGQVLPHYQPLVGVRSKRVHGFEVLARWQHPQRGMISPANFIPLAERNGTLSTLTRQLLEQAVAQLVAWKSAAPLARHWPSLSVGINISPAFGHGIAEFPDFAVSTVGAAGVSPAQVTFELTENQIAKSPGLSQLLSRLRLKGFRLAIDDFGTGNSGLDQLRRLPFTDLKIDKSFVTRASQDREAHAILEAGIHLGRSLGLVTVAEGVEREPEWQLLDRLGCDVAQGFWICPPIPAAQVAEWAALWTEQNPASVAGPA